jgi:hypothetical protein
VRATRLPCGKSSSSGRDAAAKIFEEGAPGKLMHPWIAERQKPARKDVEAAEARIERVGETERGERPGAKKGAWCTAIEQSTAGVVRAPQRSPRP